MCGLGISGCNDSVLGDSVQSGVVTEEKIDGATGGLACTCSGHVLICADREGGLGRDGVGLGASRIELGPDGTPDAAPYHPGEWHGHH